MVAPNDGIVKALEFPDKAPRSHTLFVSLRGGVLALCAALLRGTPPVED